MRTVTLFPGDGIGPEITEATKRVIAASGVAIQWEEKLAGQRATEVFGTPLPDDVIESIRRNQVALKGPLTTEIGGKGFRSVNVALRRELDLYANLRPCKTYAGVKTRYENIDLVVVRENTEDLYMGVEHMVGNDVAESIKIITRHGSERIVRFAFEYAAREKRRKVTVVHKANIMKLSDGLFLDVARGIAQEYPQIEFQDLIVDNMCMQLVQRPEQYDVLVMSNLYGDIISDLCAGLVGGLGIAPGANIGSAGSIFETVHGSAPTIAGQGIANPTALILCGVMMLNHLGETVAAQRLHRAVAAVLAEGKRTTPDIGGTASTMEMAEAIVAAMETDDGRPGAGAGG